MSENHPSPFHCNALCFICQLLSADSTSPLTAQVFSSGRVSFDIEILLPKIVTTNTWSFCVGVVPAGFTAAHTQKWVGSQVCAE